MAWNKNATNTLVSGNNEMALTGLTKKKFNVIMCHIVGSTPSFIDFKGRVGDGSFDSGTSYATRENQDGSEATRVSAQYFASGLTAYPSSNANSLTIVYAINIAAQEKLFLEWRVLGNTAGAANAPSRSEQAYKWTNTSVQFDQYEFINASGETWDTDSNISAIGTD